MTPLSGPVRILVPTTEGPVAVVDLAKEAPELEGGVAIVHDTTQIAGISADYDAWLNAPAIGLTDRLGHRAWRLELSADIETGRSWEAGVLLAHALQAAHRLPVVGAEPAATVWVTGSVEPDGLVIGPVDHVEHKLQTSISVLDQALAAGQRILVVLPPGSADQVDLETRKTLVNRGILIRTCASFDEIARLVGVSLPPRPIIRAPSRYPPRRVAIAAMSGVAMLVILGVNSPWPRRVVPDEAMELPRDCDVCPVMVAIPRPVPNALDDPARTSGAATAHDRIAVGKYEVTIGEYEAFVAATGHPVPDSCNIPTRDGTYGWHWAARSFRAPSYPVTPRHPVTCVSYDDATAYASWVAGKTGRPYRLPTDREWDFAARAGTTTNYSFGDDDAELCKYGRFAHAGTPIGKLRNVLVECGDNDHHGTLPVGSLLPNRWKLYDMHGNVWEWVSDCRPRPQQNTVHANGSNGGAPVASSCDYGIVRSGGYNSRPPQLRSSNFDIERRTDRGRSDSKGFRLALTLDDGCQ